MGKSKLLVLDVPEAFKQAAETLVTARRVAEERGTGEELANIALTWMELAVRMSSDAGNIKADDRKVGFHHDG